MGTDGSTRIVGTGSLAHALREVFSEHPPFSPASRATVASRDELSPDTIIYALDQPNLPRLLRMNRECAQRRSVLLPAWIEFGEVRVGPWVNARGEPGCLACYHVRRARNWARRAEHMEACRIAVRAARVSPSASPPALRFAACVVRAVASDTSRAAGAGPAVLRVDLSTLDIKRDGFLAINSCSVCARQPDDPAPATFELVEAGEADETEDVARGWRRRDLSLQSDVLSALYVNEQTGIATTVGIDGTNALCAVGSARMNIGGHEEWTAGLSGSFNQSKAVAVIEAVERYSGLRPRSARTTIRVPTSALADEHLSPLDVPLYGEWQYRLPGFPCVPFDPDMPIQWIEGRSLRTDRTVLVPKQLVYYDSAQYARTEYFVVETSSGSASGSSPLEAAFYALLEVIERDAVFRTWYRMVPPPRFDLQSIASPAARVLYQRFRELSGYELHALDITQPEGIPAVWLLALGTSEGGPRTYSASGAAPDAEVALYRALKELVGGFPYHCEQYLARRASLLKLLDKSSTVLDKFDHSLMAGLPEAYEHFEFLLGDDKHVRTLADTSAECGLSTRAGAGALAYQVAGRLADHGYDAIVVDQSNPEGLRGGIFTARALVPGFVPMTIAHMLRRTANCKRLGTGPLNEFPHPFP